MTKFSNGKLRYLIELSGAGAILVGLIFVGLELRQNTAAMQAATMQGLSESTTEYMLLLASDKELNRIMRKGRRDPTALDETESSQFFYIQRTRWLRFQMAFLQWRRGTLGDDDWSFYRRFACRGSDDVDWERQKSSLLEDFVELVETCNQKQDFPQQE